MFRSIHVLPISKSFPYESVILTYDSVVFTKDTSTVQSLPIDSMVTNETLCYSDILMKDTGVIQICQLIKVIERTQFPYLELQRAEEQISCVSAYLTH